MRASDLAARSTRADNKNNAAASAATILHHEICRVYIKYAPDSNRFARNRERHFRDAPRTGRQHETYH